MTIHTIPALLVIIAFALLVICLALRVDFENRRAMRRRQRIEQERVNAAWERSKQR